MRRSVVVTLVSAMLLAGCADTGRVSELEAQLEDARDRASDVISRMSDLELAVLNLRSEVDDFAREDWRSNVPDVESATEEVECAFYYVQSGLADLELAL
jgi:hypothetical protein